MCPQPGKPYYFYANNTHRIWRIHECGVYPDEYVARIGDLFIDVLTGNLYIQTECGWKLKCELRGCQGPTGDSSLNGITGPTGTTGAMGTIIECICIELTGKNGTVEPDLVQSLTPVEGDFYLQMQPMGDCNLFQYLSGSWQSKSNLSGILDKEGNQLATPFYYLSISVQDGKQRIILVNDLANDDCVIFTLRVNDKVLDC